MQVYVAGSLADASQVREVQAAVRSRGHDVVHDWTSGLDISLTSYRDDPTSSAAIAATDLRAVIEADAVLLVLTESPGVGMFVELGAALACVERGEHKHVVIVGRETTESVFFFHPAVQRCESADEWLDSL